MKHTERPLPVLIKRAEKVLTRIARGEDGVPLTYGNLALLITEEDESVISRLLVGKILYGLSALHANDDGKYLVAFVVSKKTGDPSVGYYDDSKRDGVKLLPPTEARKLAHEWAKNPSFPRG